MSLGYLCHDTCFVVLCCMYQCQKVGHWLLKTGGHGTPDVISANLHRNSYLSVIFIVCRYHLKSSPLKSLSFHFKLADGKGASNDPSTTRPSVGKHVRQTFLFLAHQTDPLFNLKYFMIVKFINFLFNYLDDTECVLCIIYLFGCCVVFIVYLSYLVVMSHSLAIESLFLLC